MLVVPPGFAQAAYRRVRLIDAVTGVPGPAHRRATYREWKAGRRAATSQLMAALCKALALLAPSESLSDLGAV